MSTIKEFVDNAVKRFMESSAGKKIMGTIAKMKASIMSASTDGTYKTGISVKIGNFVAEVLKRFKKNINQDKVKGTVQKIVDKVIRVASIIGTAVLAVLVAYAIVKILPLIIGAVIVMFAAYIIIEFMFSMISTAVGA
jgi:hypothetical protein